MGNFKKIFKAGVLGTIFGSILGLLYAKKPGQETRKELKEKIEDTKEKAIQSAKEVAEKARTVKNEIQEGVEEVKEIFTEEEKKEE